MSEDYGYVYIRVQNQDDAQIVMDALPFLSASPIVVCGDTDAIVFLKKHYVGKLAVIADNA
jgi:hypothetical protein